MLFHLFVCLSYSHFIISYHFIVFHLKMKLNQLKQEELLLTCCHVLAGIWPIRAPAAAEWAEQHFSLWGYIAHPSIKYSDEKVLQYRKTNLLWNGI